MSHTDLVVAILSLRLDIGRMVRRYEDMIFCWLHSLTPLSESIFMEGTQRGM